MNWILLFIFGMFSGVAHALTATEVLKKVDEIRAPGEDFSFSVRIESVRDGKRAREVDLKVRVKDSTKSVVVYEAPINARGKKLLMVDDNMWIYVPGTRRPIRISPQQRLLGQVSNADVARVVYELDYIPETMTQEKYNGDDVYRLKLVAKSSSTAYNKIVLLVTSTDSSPLMGEFYAVSGRLLKRVFYQDYQPVLGRNRPMRIEVQDAINSSNRSYLVYSDLRLQKTPDIYFQKDYMPHL